MVGRTTKTGTRVNVGTVHDPVIPVCFQDTDPPTDHDLRLSTLKLESLAKRGYCSEVEPGVGRKSRKNCGGWIDGQASAASAVRIGECFQAAVSPEPTAQADALVEERGDTLVDISEGNTSGAMTPPRLRRHPSR